MSEAKTHVIDGKTFVEVERKAKVGEKVIIADNTEFDGRIGEVTFDYYDGGVSVDINDDSIDYYPYLHAYEYRVLSEVVEKDQAPTNNDDIIANLVRRVAALERAKDSLERQLRDTQNNVERQGVEFANLEAATKAPQSGATLLADAFEALARYERSDGR